MIVIQNSNYQKTSSHLLSHIYCETKILSECRFENVIDIKAEPVEF